jgi:hypothetical protein
VGDRIMNFRNSPADQICQIKRAPEFETRVAVARTRLAVCQLG